MKVMPPPPPSLPHISTIQNKLNGENPPTLSRATQTEATASNASSDSLVQRFLYSHPPELFYRGLLEASFLI